MEEPIEHNLVFWFFVDLFSCVQTQSRPAGRGAVRRAGPGAMRVAAVPGPAHGVSPPQAQLQPPPLHGSAFAQPQASQHVKCTLLFARVSYVDPDETAIDAPPGSRHSEFSTGSHSEDRSRPGCRGQNFYKFIELHFFPKKANLQLLQWLNLMPFLIMKRR